MSDATPNALVTSPYQHRRRASVLGLGPMGAALAQALLGAGHQTTVWNRSAKNLSVVGLDAAHLVSDAAHAVRDAETVIVCVRDHEASRALLRQIAEAVPAGVPVVNVSTGTPDEALESATDARALGIGYVTGAIMVPTPLIGTDENLILCAGAPETIAAAEPVLASLGGTIDVVGEDHAVPPVLDMAMLDVFFAGMYSFLHSAALVRAHGIEPHAYLPYATGILTTLSSSLPSLANAFANRRYDSGEARLSMCLSFLNHIVSTSEASSVDPALPRLIRDATQKQFDRGLGDSEWDCVAEGLTEPA